MSLRKLPELARAPAKAETTARQLGLLDSNSGRPMNAPVGCADIAGRSARGAAPLLQGLALLLAVAGRHRRRRIDLREGRGVESNRHSGAGARRGG